MPSMLCHMLCALLPMVAMSAAVPCRASTASPDSIIAAAMAATEPIAGVWQMDGQGAILAIAPQHARPGCFDVYVLESPDLSVVAGTHCGTLTAAPNAGNYDGRLLIDPRTSASRRRYADCSLHLDASASRFTIKPYRRNKRVSLWRWIPYLFRVTVIDESNRPDGLDGAVRLTAPPHIPGSPIVL